MMLLKPSIQSYGLATPSSKSLGWPVAGKLVAKWQTGHNLSGTKIGWATTVAVPSKAWPLRPLTTVKGSRNSRV